MSTLLKLNLSEIVAEKDGVDLLSEGMHQFKIEDVEIKQSKGGGYYLNLSCKVTSGVDAGKSINEMLNIVHSNEDAQRIALARLKKILEVGGHANPSYVEDAKELIGMLFVGQVVNREEVWKNMKAPLFFSQFQNYMKML